MIPWLNYPSISKYHSNACTLEGKTRGSGVIPIPSFVNCNVLAQGVNW